ncbi:MAG: serine hydrolase domain-containing protein [Candidatus Hodarchaeales archaeon]|jgi:CubicO group peptidase (beta-lactamase class C family)
MFLISGCVNPEESSSWPKEDWKTTTPEEQEMNSTVLGTMISHIEERVTGMHSVLVIRNGYIVEEEYFNDWDRDLEHELYSCTKSVTSALVGIAIDQGYFEIDDYVLDFFPDKEFENVDERKQNMTVKHLLQMKSGLEWDEWSTDYMVYSNPVQKMLKSDDWVKHVLDQPMVEEPGSKFTYNTGISHVLSAIIQKTTKVTTFSFAKQYLFDPLGIELGYWMTSPQDIVWGGAGLQLTPRDMAKFGLLFLNNGNWDGKQIVSEEWVEKSTHEYFHLWDATYYAFQWWIFPETFDYFTFTASGYKGQWITVIPDLNLLVIFTADSTSSFYRDLLTNYIIPAVTSSTS